MFGGMRRLFSRFGAAALVLVFFVGIGLVFSASIPSMAHAASYEPPDSSWSSALVNFIGSTLAQIINFLGDAIGSLTLVIIEVIVVNVLSYNNFSNSNIVTLGWTITRDMVNMVAVIVLLILAVKTMIGQTANAWQQHLPRFFLGIVAANFSRTLLGLVVDASQIVMMTFVNALMSIAAGNFAQLMVMPSATTYSSATFEGATEAGVTLVTLAANIANAYVKLMVQVAVMVVMLLLAIAFIWRIVMLWIAFIMAPLAGFSWGSKEIVGFLGRVWQEWIGATVPPLVLGPMLAFFMYLALAASSNGNLAKTEAFPEPEKRTTYGQITLEIFESTNFTGLLIAIVFLLMGLQQSAKVASKMGGLASMMFNEKTGKRVLTMGARVSGATVGTVAKLGTRGALKLGGAAGSGIQLATNKLTAGRTGAFSSAVRGVGGIAGAAGSIANAVDGQVGLIPTDVTKLPGYAKNRGAAMAKGTGKVASGIGAGLSGAIARNVSNPTLAGALNALGPNALLAAGSALNTQEHHVSEAEAKAAKERVSHMTSQEKAARLQQFLDGTGEQSVEAMADAQNLKGLLLTDKNFENSFKATSGNKFEEHVETVLGQLQHEADGGHLSVDKETWNKARSKYVDAYAKVNSGKAKEFIDSEDFNGRLMRSKAAADSTVLGHLGVSTAKFENGNRITKLDELNRGGYGSTKTSDAASHLPRTSIASGAVVESLIQGRANISSLAEDEVKQEANAAAAAGRAPTFTSATIKQEFTTQVMQTQEVENITKAFDNGQFDESHLRDTMFNSATNTNADKAVLALAQSEKMDFSKMNAAAVSQVSAQLAAMEAAGGRINAESANALRKKMLQAGKTVSDVIPGVDVNPATNPTMSLGGAERVKTQQLFRVDPSSISQINAAVTHAVAAGARNDFTKTVVDGLSKEDFKKLSDMFSKETDAGRKAAIKAAMKTINDSLALHESTATSPAERKTIKGLRAAHDSADRYMI